MAGVVVPVHDLVYAGLAKEATFGTLVAPAYFPKVLDSAFIPTQKVEDYRNGNSLDIAYSQKQAIDWGGALSTPMFPVEFAFLMAGLLGLDTKTGSGDPYTHTITPSATHAFHSFEGSYYENGLIDRVECKISKAVIKAAVGKDVEVQVTFVGGTTIQIIATGSAATVTFNDALTEGPMRMADGVFTLTGPASQSALNMALMIQSYELTYDRAATNEHGSGSHAPIYTMGHARTCSLKLTTLFNDASLYWLTHYGVNTGPSGYSPVVGTGSCSAVFTPASGGTHTITLATPQLNWKTAKQIGKADGKTGTMDFEAVAILGASPILTAACLNAVSTAF